MNIKYGLAVFAFLASIAVSDGFAIINGQIETDHAAVGVVTDGAGNMGSAVLIDPYWVLTSAAFACACTDGFFHVGLDYAAPDAVHTISGIFPHPNYDPFTSDHNIALLRLATPVAGVTPIPRLTSQSAVFTGETIRFVGYGWTSLNDDSNTIRHACLSYIDELYQTTFITYNTNAVPYMGDAGGPALLDVGGVLRVAGLVSIIAANSLDYTVSTRISPYAPFIEMVMTEHPPTSVAMHDLPADRILHASPNPFNPSTEIFVMLDRAEFCRLAVFGPRGRKITDLRGGHLSAGLNTVSWNGRSSSGRDMPSGIYLVVLRTNSHVETIKLVLAR